jgi:hypothetical protein
MTFLKEVASVFRQEAVAIGVALAVAGAAGYGTIAMLIHKVVPAEVLFQSLLPGAPIYALALAAAAVVLRYLVIDRGSSAGCIACAVTYVWVHWGPVRDVPVEQLAERLAIFTGSTIVVAAAVALSYNYCLDWLGSRSHGKIRLTQEAAPQ